MERIKRVTAILDEFVVVSLFAPVEPDRNQPQHGKALTLEEMGLAPELKLIAIAAQQFRVDIPQT